MLFTRLNQPHDSALFGALLVSKIMMGPYKKVTLVKLLHLTVKPAQITQLSQMYYLHINLMLFVCNYLLMYYHSQVHSTMQQSIQHTQTRANNTYTRASTHTDTHSLARTHTNASNHRTLCLSVRPCVFYMSRYRFSQTHSLTHVHTHTCANTQTHIQRHRRTHSH